ncbi:MAG: hypothetical protein ACI4HO_08635 [Ruminococcus sp.]
MADTTKFRFENGRVICDEIFWDPRGYNTMVAKINGEYYTVLKTQEKEPKGQNLRRQYREPSARSLKASERIMIRSQAFWAYGLTLENMRNPYC